MNIRISFADQFGHAHYLLESDSARLQGSRTTFGAALQIHTLTPAQPTKDVPLLFFGSLAWAGESHGLPIPPQAIGGGDSALLLPITDAQIAAVENARKAGAPTFSLRLRVIAQNEQGEVRQYGGLGGGDAYPYTVPVEVWHNALDACGFGRIRIVELPPPPEPSAGDWKRAGDLLVRAAVELRAGNYGASTTSSRTALQHLVATMETRLGIEQKGTFSDRVNALAKRLGDLHQKNGLDPYNVHAELVKAVFGFQSGPAHQGPDLAGREDAEFALSLTTALYVYAVRRPLPSPIIKTED